MRERVASEMERKGSVGEVRLGMRGQVRGKVGEAPDRQRMPILRRQRASDMASAGAASAGFGASSRTTCALVPPMPSEVTPARRGWLF